jgi:hypothetical protein
MESVIPNMASHHTAFQLDEEEKLPNRNKEA